MIRALPVKSKAKWPQLLQTLTLSYNCTVHETTRVAPFLSMFGRIPRLLIDIMFSACPLWWQSDQPSWVHHRTEERLEHSCWNCPETQSQRTEPSCHSLQSKVRGTPLAVGDRVLLANRGVKGMKKDADKWDILYEVQSVRPEINVYRIKDAQTGREKVVHRICCFQWFLILGWWFFYIPQRGAYKALPCPTSEYLPCVRLKKETHTGLELLDARKW